MSIWVPSSNKFSEHGNPGALFPQHWSIIWSPTVSWLICSEGSRLSKRPMAHVWDAGRSPPKRRAARRPQRGPSQSPDRPIQSVWSRTLCICVFFSSLFPPFPFFSPTLFTFVPFTGGLCTANSSGAPRLPGVPQLFGALLFPFSLISPQFAPFFSFTKFLFSLIIQFFTCLST